MSAKLEVPPVAEVINPELEAWIGPAASPLIGTAYGRYEDRLRKNTTHEDGTLLPDEVIMKAAGVDSPVNTDEADEGSPSLLNAVHAAKHRIGNDYRQRRDDMRAQGIDIEPILKLALVIGDGTERNLVHYYSEQALQARGSDVTAYMDGLRRWTTQEQSHSPIIVHVAEAVGLYDEREMAAIQNALVLGGIDVTTDSFPATTAFTQPQEHLTYDHHRITGLMLGGSGRGAMQPVAGQEMAHCHMFEASNRVYFEGLDQEISDYAMCVLASVMHHFDMPASHSFPGFRTLAKTLASAGVFTRELIVGSFAQLTKSLDLENMEVVSDDAKKAKDVVLQIADIDSAHNQRIIRAQEMLRARYVKAERAAGRVPFIVGQTVQFDNRGDYTILPDAA